MRIAFVPAARLLAEREANGEALIATALLKRLAGRGHELLAYCEESRLDDIDGVQVRTVGADGLTTALGRMAFARRIARDAAGTQFDVAHLLFPLTTDDGYTLVRGAPLVCGPINLPWPGARRASTVNVAARAANVLTDAVERRWHARTLGRAERLLVTGDSSLRAISERLRGRCSPVPFGVDLDRLRPAPLPSEPVILFLSVLQERKGIEVLLRAMRWVLAAFPRARLQIAGDDPSGMRPRLEALARELRVDGAIEFLGPVAPADVPDVVARGAVFCQPSFGEPFGMTVVEAMACARPVVATAGGGVPDAVVDGRGGRLVPQGDERLLADALVHVLAHPAEAEAMGRFNRARAQSRYSIDHVVDEIETVYRQLAERDRAGAATS